MLTKEKIELILRNNLSDLKVKYGVKRIGIFGSRVRNEAHDTSDVDILVEFSRPIGWEFVDLKEHLESLLNAPVDLVTINALKPQLEKAIMEEVVFS